MNVSHDAISLGSHMSTAAKLHDKPVATGTDLLDDPALNKGTAFTAAERKRHGLEGLLPATVETIDRQLERVMGHLDQSRTTWNATST